MIRTPMGPSTRLLWQRAVKLGTVILHIVPNIKYYYGSTLQQTGSRPFWIEANLKQSCKSLFISVIQLKR